MKGYATVNPTHVTIKVKNKEELAKLREMIIYEETQEINFDKLSVEVPFFVQGEAFICEEPDKNYISFDTSWSVFDNVFSELARQLGFSVYCEVCDENFTEKTYDCVLTPEEDGTVNIEYGIKSNFEIFKTTIRMCPYVLPYAKYDAESDSVVIYDERIEEVNSKKDQQRKDYFEKLPELSTEETASELYKRFLGR